MKETAASVHVAVVFLTACDAQKDHRMQNGSPKPGRTWQELAHALEKEQNPKKAIELAEQLNQALLAEEKRKAEKRGERRPDRGSTST
jgi:hypothetical protein